MAARALLRTTTRRCASRVRTYRTRDPVNRVLAAAPLLEDSVRGVRVEARGSSPMCLTIPIFRRVGAARRAAALNEYIAALAAGCRLATATSAWAICICARPGEQAIAPRARTETRCTVRRRVCEPRDVYRMQARDDLSEPVLRRGLAQLPKAADLHHALGLLLVRKGDTAAH